MKHSTLEHKLVLAILLLCPVLAQTQAPSGFFRGPALQLSIGARSANFDFNIADNTPIARSVEPTYGFNLGWFTRDSWGYEFSGLYSTSGSNSRQEHLLHFQVHGRYNLIIPALASSAKLRIIPFVSAGPVFEINIMPNAQAAATTRVTQIAGGASIGAGISLLSFHDHFYFTLRGDTQGIYRQGITQRISTVNTQVYEGGWDTGWNSSALIGVHF